MSRALYLNKSDARDIRNLDMILSNHEAAKQMIPNNDLRRDLWVLFRTWRVRLDKSGDTTQPFQAVNPRKRKVGK